VNNLVSLQTIDLSMDELNKLLENCLDEINLQEMASKTRLQQLQDTRKNLEDLNKKRKTLEIEVGALDTKISKYQNQLYDVKSNKEYDALKLEIASGKDEKAKLEENLLTLLFQEDDLKSAIQHMTVEVESLKKENLKKQDEIKKKMSDLEKNLDEKKTDRTKIIQLLPTNYSDEYENMKKSGKKIVIAPILENNMCGGCFISVPPQMVIEIQADDKLCRCSCGRYLYWKR
jgi:predicted  nucleic acid-binding Zn-ribbon protein